MNDISATIFYNKRIILSAPIATPVTWHCSKVEQTAPKGISHITFAQETFDEHVDAFQYDDGTFSHKFDPTKKVIGMWANYYGSSITPTDPEDPEPPVSIYSVMTCSGTKKEIKSGGSYKKITVDFFTDTDMPADFQDGIWSYQVEGKDATSLLTILTSTDSTDVAKNQIKVKFNKNDMYLGKTLTISYESIYGVKSSIELEILGL